MTPSATSDADVDLDRLDELVPPAGPWWRRTAGWLAFLVGLGGVASVWTSGIATPRTTAHVTSWGGAGPVFVAVHIENETRVEIEITRGPQTPAGLRVVGYGVNDWSAADPAIPETLQDDPFPITLDGHSVVSLEIWYAVEDCDAVAAETDDDITYRARIANGPFGLVPRTRTATTYDRLPGAENDAGWPSAVAQLACP